MPNLKKIIHFEPQRNNIMNSCKKRATVVETIPVEKKQRTETIDSDDHCSIDNVSDDILRLINEYTGKNQYYFIACVSKRFLHVNLDTFGGDKLTSFKNAAVSVSCARLCLDSEEEPGCFGRARSLFRIAAIEGKADVLKWGEDSGYKMKNLLDQNTIADVASNGHLEMAKYLRQLGIPWDFLTCANAAENGHLELLKWARANQCPCGEYTI
jgi:hypothetical protein